MKDFSETIEALGDFESQEEIEVPFFTPEPKPEWLFDWCVDVCGHWKLSPQPHYELINQIEPLIGDCTFPSHTPSGEEIINKPKVVLVPRGNYKTTILCEDLVLAIIARNPEARILITANNIQLAKERLQAIKFHLENNKNFHELYGNGWKPKDKSIPWASDRIQVAKRKGIYREPTVTVGAVGADVTGKHFNVIITDDVVDDKNTRKKEQRDKVEKYIQNLEPLLDPGGVMLILGTHWHPDDAYVRFKKRDDAKIEEGKSALYDWYVRGCYDGPNGLYFPSQCGHEFLDRKRESSASLFACSYLNQPVAHEDLVFKPEYYREEDFTFHTTRNENVIETRTGRYIPVDVVMSWDTAGTKATSKSDYHGIVIAGMDGEKTLWTLHAEQKRGNASEIVSRVASLIQMYKPRKILVDAMASFGLWKNELTTRLEIYGERIAIDEYKHKGVPKEERIAMMEPRYTAGKWVIKPGQTALREQIQDFSMDNKLAHDDIIDAAAMLEGQFRDPGILHRFQDVNSYDSHYAEYLQEKGQNRRVFFGRPY